MRLGAVADDLTGATDLASRLVEGGMPAVVIVGVPASSPPPDADAAVVALKTRTVGPAIAVERSVAAVRRLRAAGAQQIYFKYCSTMDSTAEGNIGPVIDALLDDLDAPFTVAVPALPDNGRTMYMGHLFVGDRLLSESGMEHHPLTPMTDPDVVRVLQRQTAHRVGLIEHAAVRAGAAEIGRGMEALCDRGVGVAVVDVICNADLREIGAAAKDLPLVTGGSGLALGLPRNWGIDGAARPAPLSPCAPPRAVVAGSCSPATERQVGDFLSRGGAGFHVDPLRLAAGEDVVAAALSWAAPRLAGGPVLVSTTDAPKTVAAVQATLGVETAAAVVERALAAIARGLVDLGAGRLVVAGGETAGACVQALGLEELRVGRPIDPGVPWCSGVATAVGDAPVHVALKSGNFGADDFFTRAFECAA